MLEQNNKKSFELILKNIKSLNKLLKKENLLLESNKIEDAVIYLPQKLEISNILEELYKKVRNCNYKVSNNLKSKILLQQNIMRDLAIINKKHLEKEQVANRTILEMLVQAKNHSVNEHKRYNHLKQIKISTYI